MTIDGKKEKCRYIVPLRDGECNRTRCYSEEIFRHMNINFFHRTKYYSGVPLLFMFPRYNIPVRYNTIQYSTPSCKAIEPETDM